MASDAFFPMPDTVQEAIKAGVTAIIQPGGSIKDQLSIDECMNMASQWYLQGFVILNINI